MVSIGSTSPTIAIFPKNKRNLFGLFNISEASNRKFNYTLLFLRKYITNPN